MGLRTWLYKTTGIKLKQFDTPTPPPPSSTASDTALEELAVKVTLLEQENQQLLQRLAACEPFAPKFDNTYQVEEEFQCDGKSSAALQKLIKDFEFESVVDIGAGSMQHSKIFAKHGKKVTAIDYGDSVPYKKYKEEDGVVIEQMIGDFNSMEINEQFDCVWSSHSLEHQINSNLFLQKVISITKENGIIAITVPPLKRQIVSGHVSLWNAGLLLYHLVLAGLDCSNASVLSYGYNISIILRKKTITLPYINFDVGDIKRLKEFLPKDLEFHVHSKIDEAFHGDITRLNWD